MLHNFRHTAPPQHTSAHLSTAQSTAHPGPQDTPSACQQPTTTTPAPHSHQQPHKDILQTWHSCLNSADPSSPHCRSKLSRSSNRPSAQTFHHRYCTVPSPPAICNEHLAFSPHYCSRLKSHPFQPTRTTHTIHHSHFTAQHSTALRCCRHTAPPQVPS